MDLRILPRPLTELVSGRSQCLLALNASSRRHQSSYRRTRSRLNVKPDASFLSGKDSPNEDHIIYNPPSAAPSILNTPLKFLPKDDPRVSLYARAQLLQKPATNVLPPPARPKYLNVPKNHLTDVEIREMQRLRLQDGDTWSSLKLARKFNCSKAFVVTAMSVLDDHEAAAARKKAREAKAEAVKARWGPRRAKARADRVKRYEIALRDE